MEPVAPEAGSPTHYKWNTDRLAAGTGNRFEVLADELMVEHLAAIDSSYAPEEIVSGFHGSLTLAAVKTIGRRLVSRTSKPWLDGEIQEIIRQRRHILRDISKCGVANCALLERSRQVSTKLSRLSRMKRKAAQLQFCREVEADPSGKLLWTKWKQRSKLNANGMPSVILDDKGDLVVEPAKVRATWAKYVEQLGEGDSLDKEQDSGHCAPGGVDAVVKENLFSCRLADVGDAITSCERRVTKFDDVYARRVLSALETMDPMSRVIPELDKPIAVESGVGASPWESCRGRRHYGRVTQAGRHWHGDGTSSAL